MKSLVEKIVEKKPFAGERNIAVKCLIYILYFMVFSCEKQSNDLEYECNTSNWFSIGSQWYFQYVSSQSGEDFFERTTFSVEKDTIVRGKACSIVRGVHSSEVVYVENGRVYYDFQNKFRKIYDFNVKVGDVVDFEFKYSSDGTFDLDKTVVLRFRVDGISTIIVDGVELRRIYTSRRSDNETFQHIYTERLGFEGNSFPFFGFFPSRPDRIVPAMFQTLLLWYQDNDIEYIIPSGAHIFDWWQVSLRYKYKTDEGFLATRDSEIIALTAKHRVTFKQTNPHALIGGEAFRIYNMVGRGNNMNDAIRDFLATGKFEDEFFVYKNE